MTAGELVGVLGCVGVALEKLEGEGVGVVQVTARDVVVCLERRYKLLCRV